ncbi:MAG: prepilin peptidase [Pseudomonadota bacterium]
MLDINLSSYGDYFPVAFFSLLFFSALYDLKFHKIKNSIVLFIFILGFTYQILFGKGFFTSFFGALIGFAIFLPAYIFKITGAGDVKLIAATGSFLGFDNALISILATLIAGGIFGAAIMLVNGRLYQLIEDFYFAILNFQNGLGVSAFKIQHRNNHSLQTHHEKSGQYKIPEKRVQKFPYAIAIATGAFIAWKY